MREFKKNTQHKIKTTKKNLIRHTQNKLIRDMITL